MIIMMARSSKPCAKTSGALAGVPKAERSLTRHTADEHSATLQAAAYENIKHLLITDNNFLSFLLCRMVNYY